MMRSAARPSVLLIREGEQQSVSNPCSGELGNDFLPLGGRLPSAEKRATMESLGPLYRSLRRDFGGSVDLQVIDPRNLLSLVFLVARDLRTYRVGFREALRTIGTLPTHGVVVNGRVFTRGEWPSVREMTVLLESLTRDATSR